MTLETRREALELHRIAGAVCIARRDEIGVGRLRERSGSDAGSNGKHERRAGARGGRQKS